jgi:ketosteroid isomerase-like protein
MTNVSQASAADFAAIDQLRDAWIDGVQRGDAERLRDCLVPEYELWANGSAPLGGRDVVVAAVVKARQRWGEVRQSFDAVETVLHGGHGFQRGVERLRLVPLDGSATREIVQRAMLILARGEDGRWRYARAMTNAPE